MNDIKLTGIIRNIQPSHKIADVEYDKAEMLVKRKDGKEDVINLRFKKFTNKYKDNQSVELVGNVRSYSQQTSSGKNKVDIYVFTYFDRPEYADSDEEIESNKFSIDGRICKIDELRTTSDSKQNLHFILANNLIIEDNKQKLNSYLPCLAWGKIAKELSTLSVNDAVSISGELHSREYKKVLDNGEVEIKVAHELVISDYKLITATTKEV